MSGRETVSGALPQRSHPGVVNVLHVGRFTINPDPFTPCPDCDEDHGVPTIQGAALVVDVREGTGLHAFPKVYKDIRQYVHARLLFLEADDEAIVRRFSETRRPHPLGMEQSLLGNIQAERAKLASIRALADLTINTTKFTVHQLRDFIGERFRGRRDESHITIYVTSFGFRNGLPPESDLVFDVRFLPNPNYIPKYKNLNGQNPAVARYIRSFPQTGEFLDRINRQSYRSRTAKQSRMSSKVKNVGQLQCRGSRRGRKGKPTERSLAKRLALR